MNVYRFAILVVLAAAITITAGAETPVCTDPADQRNAVISGDVVAWEDSRNGNWDIYMKRLATNAESRVSASTGDETNPDIDGGRIVYQSGAGDILLYDIVTGATSTVVSATGEQSRPRISGNWIAWQDHRGSDWDVYLSNLATGTERRMTDPGDQHSPSVDGNQTVWVSVDASTGEASVVAYDAASASTFLVADTGHPSAPDIGGGAVTYLARDEAGERVYRRAITGGIPRVLSVGTGDHVGQRIDGARVALEIVGSGIWVYSMNFETGTRITSTGTDVTDRNPAIDGTLVVWESNRNGNWDIYAGTADAGPVTSMPVSTVATAAPSPTSAQPASRFGTRRYVVGAVAPNPPAGITGGAGRMIAAATRSRAVVGAGTARGLSPPPTRFVRWSPVTRWRSEAR